MAGRTRKRTERGSAIVAAAIAAAILSIVVAGFLTYMTNEGRLAARSLAWKQALHLAEAAAEIGVAEFNYQYTEGGIGFSSGRGWASLGGGSYRKTVSNFTDNAGNVLGTLDVTVSGVGSSNPQVQGVGTANCAIGSQPVSRAVQVGFAGGSLFPMGLISKNNITLNGNAEIDSYNSSAPAKSNGGLYDTSRKQANGNIATISTASGSISMNGNAEVYGVVATGSGGTATLNGNAQIGPTFVSDNRANSAAQAEANGWLTHNYTTTITDVSLPSGLDAASSLGQIKNSMTINGGDWQATSISLSGNKTVTISGTVRLYVTGSTSISGNANINISSGGKLEVYAAGSVSVSGNGVNNNSTTPDKNQWFGLSSCTSWSMSGNANWIGTVYAPQADLSTTGNGDVSGALVAATITVSGNGHYHYDESLQSGGGGGGTFSVASWQELRNVNGSWVP